MDLASPDFLDYRSAMDNIIPPKITVAALCDALGRKEIAAACGVGLTQVSNACVENKFSAKWFAVIRAMCAEVHMECPEHLFTFIGVRQDEIEAS